jgi:hypothetical protein
MTAIDLDASGRALLGFADGRLLVIEPDGRRKELLRPDLAAIRISGLALAPNGAFWLFEDAPDLGQEGGRIRYCPEDVAQACRSLGSDEGLPGASVYALAGDPEQDRVFVGTDAGLAVCAAGVCDQVYDSFTGLPHDDVRVISIRSSDAEVATVVVVGHGDAPEITQILPDLTEFARSLGALEESDARILALAQDSDLKIWPCKRTAGLPGLPARQKRSK